MEVEPEILGPKDDPETFEGNYEYKSWTESPPLHRRVAFFAMSNVPARTIATECGIKLRIVNKILDHAPIREWVAECRESVAMAETEDYHAYNALRKLAIKNAAELMNSDDERIKLRATQDFLDRERTGLFMKQRKVNTMPSLGTMDGSAIAGLKQRAKLITQGETENGEETDSDSDGKRNDRPRDPETHRFTKA